MMKYTKVADGIYKSESGYTIKKNVSRNIFTGRDMAGCVWHIFNSDNEKVDFGLTLKEAKHIVENEL